MLQTNLDRNGVELPVFMFIEFLKTCIKNASTKRAPCIIISQNRAKDPPRTTQEHTMPMRSGDFILCGEKVNNMELRFGGVPSKLFQLLLFSRRGDENGDWILCGERLAQVLLAMKHRHRRAAHSQTRHSKRSTWSMRSGDFILCGERPTEVLSKHRRAGPAQAHRSHC